MRTVMLLVSLWIATPLWSQDFPLESFRIFREQKGLPVPSWDENLAATCRFRSQTLAQSGSLSHDAEGKGPGAQLVAQGFPPGVYGEVLGAGADPEAVWKAWMASPSHRAVLADPLWQTWGWGATRDGLTTVWVIRFRRP